MAVRNLVNVKDFVEKQGVKKLVEVVSDAFTMVHQISPVWSGSYIHSHRIGIDHIDENWSNMQTEVYTGDIGKEEYAAVKANEPILRASAMATIPGHLAALKNAVDPKTIYISNSTPWAIDVEELWNHYVYQKVSMWVQI